MAFVAVFRLMAETVSVYRENALPPKLRAEIEAETSARVKAFRHRLQEQRSEIENVLGTAPGSFQYVRASKRMEMAVRLTHFIKAEHARGNTDGYAFAALGLEDLKHFVRLFDDELRFWKSYPTAPNVCPAVLNVRDFGANGDGRTDNWKAFAAAVEAVRQLKGRPAILEIPEGEFFFGTAVPALGKSNKTQFALTGLTNCLVRGVSPEKTRLRFGVYNAFAGVYIYHSANTTLANVDVAMSETPFMQGDALEFNKEEGWVRLRHQPGTMRPNDPRLTEPGKTQCLGIFNAEGREILYQEMFHACRADDLGGGEYRLYLDKDHFIYKRPSSHLEPGWKIVVPHRGDWNRILGTGTGSYCCNFQNVWIRNSRSGAIGFDEGRYSTAWKVKVFPLKKEFVTSADADGVYNLRGTFVGHCSFDQVNDDGSNSFAYGWKVRGVEGANTILSDGLTGDFRPGDLVQIIRPGTCEFLYLGRIAKPGRKREDGWTEGRTVFEEPVPADLAGTEAKRPDRIFGPNQYGVGFVVMKSRFTSLRGTGSVVACPNTLLEDNVYEYMNRGVSLSCMIHEGPSPYNVVIRNCSFDHIDTAVEGRVISPEGRKAASEPVRGVILERNRFGKAVVTPLVKTNIGDDLKIVDLREER